MCILFMQVQKQAKPRDVRILITIGKGHQSNFWGADNVLCLDLGAGYLSMLVSEHSPSCILTICAR